MATKTVEVHFMGRVQGVGFRFTVQQMASTLPVSGFVRNEMDGSVFLLAEGEEKCLKSLLDLIRSSHLGKGIKYESVQWNRCRNMYDRFTVDY